MVKGKKLKIIAKYSRVITKNNLNLSSIGNDNGRERMRDGGREERGREWGGQGREFEGGGMYMRGKYKYIELLY